MASASDPGQNLVATRAVAAGTALGAALRRPDRQILLLAFAGVAATLVGVFSTWATADTYTLNGIQGPQNGWLAVIFALIGLATAPAVARRSWLGIATTLVVAAAVLTTVIDNQGVAGLDTGWGYWLTLAGGTLFAAAGLLSIATRVRPGHGSGQEPSESPESLPRPQREDR